MASTTEIYIDEVAPQWQPIVDTLDLESCLSQRGIPLRACLQGAYVKLDRTTLPVIFFTRSATVTMSSSKTRGDVAAKDDQQSDDPLRFPTGCTRLPLRNVYGIVVPAFRSYAKSSVCIPQLCTESPGFSWDFYFSRDDHTLRGGGPWLDKNGNRQPESRFVVSLNLIISLIVICSRRPEDLTYRTGASYQHWHKISSGNSIARITSLTRC